MNLEFSTTKKCSRCGVVKSTSFFYVDRSKNSGFKSSCKPCSPKKKKTYRPVCDEKYRAKRAENYLRNAEKIKARVSAYAKANPDKERERSAKRYAAKLQRTLTLTKEQKTALKTIYSFAEWVSKKTGSQHHVDHIVPLKGKNMSGLHVPWNLRVISEKENLRKKNKVDDSISMPTCMNGRIRQC